MHLITSLLILLVLARVFGRLFKAMGYYPIIGDIFAGFLLGPSVFGVLETTKGLQGIVELGVFLLIFAAGLELDLKDVLRTLKKRAFICSSIICLASFSSGLAIGMLFSFPIFTSAIIGLCFVITSIPVAYGVLNNLKLADSKLGHTVMGTAVVLEIFALLVLGIIFEAKEGSSLLEFINLIVVKGFLMLIFFFSVTFANKILRSEFRHIQRTQKLFKQLIEYIGEEAIFGVGMVFVLVFSTLAEALGFHFIIGAFFGGLLLNKDIIGTNFFHSMTHTLESITKHFFTPIFFAHLGLLINTDAFDNWFLIASIVSVGYLAKIGSSWLGAKVSQFSSSDAFKIGLILNSRGTFDLIVADLAFTKGLIDAKILSILVLFGVSSVAFNPVVYRQLFSKKEQIESKSNTNT